MLSSSLVSQRLRAWIVEFMQFGVVGASAFVIDAGLFNVFQYAPMPLGFLSGHPNTANVLAATIATIYSWIANRLWTNRRRTQENVLSSLSQIFWVYASPRPVCYSPTTY